MINKSRYIGYLGFKIEELTGINNLTEDQIKDWCIEFAYDFFTKVSESKWEQLTEAEKKLHIANVNSKKNMMKKFQEIKYGEKFTRK